MKEQIISLLTVLLEASKEYTETSRKIYKELENFPKNELHILYQHDKDIKSILNEYETVFLKMQEEI